MGRDPKKYQEYLFKLQGYLMKVRDSFESLPCHNAYETLELIFDKKAYFEDGIYIKQVKPALHGIAKIASDNAVYIQQRSGVAVRPWKSKLSSKEVDIRVAGEYSHRPVEAFKIKKLPNNLKKFVNKNFSKVEEEKQNLFLLATLQNINCYLYNEWLGKPDRKEDLERLNRMRDQTQKIINETPLLTQLIVDNDCIDCYFHKEDIKKYIPVIWKLLHCTKEAIEKIQSSKANYKQLEVSFIADLACNYRLFLSLNPSADNRRGEFMNFISLIEDEMDSITKQTRKENRFGRWVVARAIKK